MRVIKVVGKVKNNTSSRKKFESGAQRLGGLIKKDKSFLGLITIPEILMSAFHVIKDEIKICGLNLEIR